MSEKENDGLTSVMPPLDRDSVVSVLRDNLNNNTPNREASRNTNRKSIGGTVTPTPGNKLSPSPRVAPSSRPLPSTPVVAFGARSSTSPASAAKTSRGIMAALMMERNENLQSVMDDACLPLLKHLSMPKDKLVAYFEKNEWAKQMVEDFAAVLKTAVVSQTGARRLQVRRRVAPAARTFFGVFFLPCMNSLSSLSLTRAPPYHPDACPRRRRPRRSCPPTSRTSSRQCEAA